jgi:Bacterial dnaA protein helix-turn-helix
MLPAIACMEDYDEPPGEAGESALADVHGFLAHAVCAAHRVPHAALLAPTRSRSAVALARQVAFYLGHVSLGLSLADIGEALGRDRTTAGHACQRIEDRRDDMLLDTALDYLDAALRTRLPYCGGDRDVGAADGHPC